MSLRTAIAFLLLATLSGCSISSDEEIFTLIDQQPPRVVRTQPADGWIEVPPGIVVKIWFSEPVDPVSVGPQSVYLASGMEWEASSYLVSEDQDGLGMVVLQPLNPLIGGVRQQLVITAGVTDLYGNPLAEDVLVQFETLR